MKLIAWTGGDFKDLRRLIVLAVKTSAGKLGLKNADYYLREYKEEGVEKHVMESHKYPSVLEHVVFTFLVEGISRVTSHQLVRHRIASYTQESQRYSAVERDYVIPDTVIKAGFEEEFRKLMDEAYRLYDKMVNAGVPYEDARYIIPQAVTTRLLMTVNLRELIHIACLRLSPHAQWELRELVKLMIDEAKSLIPELPHLLQEMCEEIQV
ncbi:MAG: FAD-dependent thymidylate synthase [Desulfurococcaceae archaeon]|nr:FAD-dependent thymidylate synthase [Desulfurococcaceae archaeon]